MGESLIKAEGALLSSGKPAPSWTREGDFDVLYMFVRISPVFLSSLYKFLRIYFVFHLYCTPLFCIQKYFSFAFIFVICVSLYFFCIFIFHPIQSCNPNQQCHVSLRDPVMKVESPKAQPTNQQRPPVLFTTLYISYRY